MDDNEPGRSRLFTFPGGTLELQSWGDEDDDYRGIYLQLHGPAELVDNGGKVVMRYKPTALGYLRTDVSGIGQLRDECQIRRLAERYGYDFADMVIFEPTLGRPPLARLKAQATRLDAEAVIVPGPEHFPGGAIPRTLVQQLDVITVVPEKTYARRVMPPLRNLPSATAD